MRRPCRTRPVRASGSRPLRPASCTSAAREPLSITSFSRGGRRAHTSCASRTPTSSARETSSPTRSSQRSTGSVSSTTRAPTGSRVAPTSTGPRPTGSSPGVRPTGRSRLPSSSRPNEKKRKRWDARTATPGPAARSRRTRAAFAHLGMILGTDRKKLSKRYGAAAVAEWRDQGIFPEALVNFLALLGWSPGNDREILSREEMEREFSLERIGASPSVFDPEKLLWMNAQYMARLPAEELLERAKPHAPAGVPGKEAALAAIELHRTRARTAIEMGLALST